MKSEEDYPVALWVERQKGTDMIYRVYKIHRTSVAMSFAEQVCFERGLELLNVFRNVFYATSSFTLTTLCNGSRSMVSEYKITLLNAETYNFS